MSVYATVTLEEFCHHHGVWGDKVSILLKAGKSILTDRCLPCNVEAVNLMCPGIDQNVTTALIGATVAGWMIALFLVMWFIGKQKKFE